MCYSLQATVASFALGTHELVWALVWLLTRDEFSTLDRAAILSTLGWIYFALLMQLVDLSAWLALHRKHAILGSAAHDDAATPIRGTEVTALFGLALTFGQPIACAAAPLAMVYVARTAWRGAILGVFLGLAAVVVPFAAWHASTLTEAQSVIHGSFSRGLAHKWWDPPYGQAGRILTPHYIYNAGQVVATVLQVVVSVLVLDGHARFTVLFVSVFFWTTYLLAYGVVGAPKKASRISTVWCWFVGGGLFLGTTVAMWPRDGALELEFFLHVVGAPVVTSLALLAAR